jgi:hypothetical protein
MGKEEKAFPGTKAHPEALRIPLTRRLFRGQKELRQCERKTAEILRLLSAIGKRNGSSDKGGIFGENGIFDRAEIVEKC